MYLPEEGSMSIKAVLKIFPKIYEYKKSINCICIKIDSVKIARQSNQHC